VGKEKIKKIGRKRKRNCNESAGGGRHKKSTNKWERVERERSRPKKKKAKNCQEER